MTASSALPATAHGWQRMPDKDTPHAVAWEAPNGLVLHVPHGLELVVARIAGVMSVAARAEGSAKP